MPRLTPPDYEDLSPAQKKIHDAITAGPRGRLAGPLAIWLTQPRMADAAQSLGEYCRFHTSLGAQLAEICICTVGVHWKAEFEWYAHRDLALKAGVSEPILDAILAGTKPPFGNEKERLVHEFTKSVLETKRVPKALYDETKAALGEEGVVDICAVAGYYCLVSVTLNAFEVELPEGVSPAFD